MKMSLLQKRLFERNLKALGKAHPELTAKLTSIEIEVEGTFEQVKDELFNFIYQPDGLPAYEDGEPEVIARHWLDRINLDNLPLSISIGIGLGWIQKVLAEQVPQVPQFIIEPSLTHFATALYCTDLTSLFELNRLHLFVGPFKIEEFETKFNEYVFIKEVELIIHEPSLILWPEVYKSPREQIDEFISFRSVNINTIQYHKDLFFKNRLENLRIAPVLKHSAFLKERFLNIPAVLVAAGPSLNEALNFLKNTYKKRNAIIFCVDAALPSLIENDIEPDFITTLDPQPITFEKFASLNRQPENSNLLFITKSQRHIPRRIGFKRLILCALGTLEENWIWKCQGIKSPSSFMLSNFNTVAHLNLAAAIFMGCNPIVLLGQDFCYWEGKSDHADKVNLAQKVKKASHIKRKSIYGEDVFTDYGWLTAKKSFEFLIGKRAKYQRILNLSKGLPLEGAENIQAEKAGKLLGQAEKNISTILETELDKELHEFDPKRLAKKVKKIIREFEKLKSSLNHITKKNYKNVENYQTQNILRQDLRTITKNKEIWNIVAELTKAGKLDKFIGVLNRAVKTEHIDSHSIKALFSFLNHSKEVIKHALNEFNGLDKQLANIIEDKYDDFDLLKLGYFPLANRNFEYYDLILKASRGEIEDVRELVNKSKEQPLLADLVPGLSELWFELIERFPYHYVERKNIKRLGLLRELSPTFVEEKCLEIWNKIFPNILKNDHHESIKWWEPFEDILPKSYQQAKIAKALVDGTDRQEFDAFLRSVKIEDTSDPFDLELAIRIKMVREEFDQALNILRQATSRHPSLATIWEEIGDMLFLQEDFEGALIAYENCAKALPQYYQVYVKIGETYKQMGLLEPANMALKLGLRRIGQQ